MRVMLDCNGFDALVRDDETMAAVVAAITSNALELWVTEAQYDEAMKAPREKVERFHRLPLHWTTTAGFVIGQSRLGAANFASNEELEIFNASAPTLKPRDVLVLLTARREGISVVTSDKKLTKACGRCSVEVLTPDELLRQLSEAPSE